VKVAHVSWLLSSAGGGIPPVARALAAAQAGLGHESALLGVRDDEGPAAAELPLCAGRVYAAVGPKAVGFAPGLAHALARLSPEVVHLHGLFTWPSQAVRRWGARAGCPVMIAPHGMLEPWALARSAWKKRLFWWLVEGDNLARAACLHALNEAEAANFRRLGLRNPVAVVPNGVDLPAEAPAPDELGRRFPLAAGRPVLLFLARLHPKKGLPALLDAWAALAAERAKDGWLLVVAGPDQLGHEAEMRARSAALGLEHDVLFTGPLAGEVKAAAFAAADGFVLPSHSEGFSIAVLEAMSYGVPVVLTRQCNFDLSRLGAGWVCEPDGGSVRGALGSFLACSCAERQAMGRRGYEAVKAGYTWEMASRKLIDVYAWMLGSGPRPAWVELAP
jgi:poly(glycerol-phosphate) alpha-glucosyltransferase